MKKIIKLSGIIIALIALYIPNIQAQSTIDEQLLNEFRALRRTVEAVSNNYNQIIKRVDDLMWREMLGDIAHVDKVRLTGNPRTTVPDPNNRFATNPTQFASYVFIPKSVDPNKKYPLIVLTHSGLPGGFSTFYVHVAREFVAQEYIVVAAEFRGGGVGSNVYEAGLEVEDVLGSRDNMVNTYPIVDPNRVGIVGWSQGAMLAMMNILTYPDKYSCAFAGVPILDRETQFNGQSPVPVYASQSSQRNSQGSERRAPSTLAGALRKPLLIHTNANGDEVLVKEMALTIDALKRQNKSFEHKVLEDFPKGHSSNWIDDGNNTELRYAIHKFLEKHLNPPKPFKTHADLRKAAYRFY